jgi:hypothetical protein
VKLTTVILLGAACAMLGYGQATQEQKPAEEKQAKPEATKPEAAKPAADSEKPGAGGKREGIKVHGHWVLEIKNPDGSVASRKEFENSLVGQGSTALSFLLMGSGQVVQNWLIQVTYNTPANAGYPNATGCSSASTCDVLTMSQPATNFCNNGFPLCNTSLTVQQNSANQVVLTGTTAPAISAGTIPSVLAFINLCSFSNNSCNPSGGYNFSQANTNLTIQTGQSIDVTVTYTFS